MIEKEKIIIILNLDLIQNLEIQEMIQGIEILSVMNVQERQVKIVIKEKVEINLLVVIDTVENDI